jgi:transketolase
MEHTSIDSDVELYKFHSGAPSEDAYAIAAQELIDSANEKLNAMKVDMLELETIILPSAVKQDNLQCLIPAYSNALIDQACKNNKIVVLDADLILDTGLIPFQQKFPERFVECGIAEQDMVSMAGTIALSGLVPIVHSFSCFLTSRASEQIYNNCTQYKKVIYVGSLAGVLPGGPGHSHQSVRDITAMSAMPGLTIIEPNSELQVSDALKWALYENDKSTYIRLTSIHFENNSMLSNLKLYNYGEGELLTEGQDLTIICYNPVLCLEVLKLLSLSEYKTNSIELISMPWINKFNVQWLSKTLNS